MKPQTFATAAGFLLAVAALLLVAGKPQPSAPAPPPPVDDRFISVTGEGEVRVKPDIAYITFGVRLEGASAAEVEALNIASVNRVGESLTDQFQISSDDLQIARPVLEQVVGPENGGARRVTAYQATSEGLVVIRNPKQVPAVLDGLAKAGATSIGRVVYSVADPDKARQTALERAMNNAKLRAAELAAAGGVQIQKLHAASASFDEWESSEGLGPPPGPVSAVPTEVVIRARVQASFTQG